MLNTLNRMKRDEGFTLIELMIVMVVLGILAGIVIFAVDPFEDAANDSVSDANNKQCSTAIAADKAAGGTGSGYASYLESPLTCTVP